MWLPSLLAMLRMAVRAPQEQQQLQLRQQKATCACARSVRGPCCLLQLLQLPAPAVRAAQTHCPRCCWCCCGCPLRPTHARCSCSRWCCWRARWRLRGVLAPVLGLGACARCLQGSGVSRECELRMGCRRFLPPPSSPSSESSPPLPLPRAPTRQPLKPPPLLLAPSRPPPPPLLLVVLPPPCCWPPVLVDSPGAEASVAQLTGEPA